MNGNVTKEGITADLEWMKRSGIAGMQMFDGDLDTPQIVANRLIWMTPAWKDALCHAAEEADRLGLEMAMAASGGWSETAGPWVKPEEAMKKLVWSEMFVEGPKKVSAVLPHPPTNNGKFQNMPEPFSPPTKADSPFYADIKVLAYRLPEGEVRMADLHPEVTTSAPSVDPAALTDGNFATTASIPLKSGETQVWVQFKFARPYRAQAITIALAAGGWAIPDGAVQASDDGAQWSTLVSLPGPAQSLSWLSTVQTYSFPETAARFFRVVLRPTARHMDLAEIELSGPRVNHWEGKAAFFHTIEFAPIPTPAVPKSAAVARKDVIDLTSKMRPDGALDWDAPPGKWAILRLGYSLTGEKNHPASPEATGYEVDKLSAKHVGNYVKTYADMVSGVLGPNFGKSFRYFLMDSWEAGVENWTDDMIVEFQKRRGYDPTPYLPALTGRIVESAEVSDRFLWDFRRTIADLLAENHYGVFTKYVNQYGIGLYAEALGGPTTTGDGLLSKRFVDVPMGEFWTPSPGEWDEPENNADLREAASAAHIYGKKFAGAESFTTDPKDPVWASPYYLKPLGDNAMALGINRFMFHTSVQQPFVDDHHKPGMTLGPFGQHYTRNTTWAEQAIAWNTYLGRCSYLLQQGKFVGDLAYFYGEGAPVAVPGGKPINPPPPQGYAYDWVNADVLLNRMSVRDGRLVLPSSMSYRVLVLPDYVNQITLPLLRKLRDLVMSGGVVVAPRPIGSPSQADYVDVRPNGARPGASGARARGKEAEYQSMVSELWGAVDGAAVTEHDYGKGKIFWGKPLNEILAGEKTPADFRYNRPEFDSLVVWIHRQEGNTDIYFISNQRERAEDFETSFRVDGKEAELWHPDTGLIEPAEYTIANGRTSVPLHFDPYGSVFVVFRRTAAMASRRLPHAVNIELATIQGPWQVSFPPNWGAPPQAQFDSLISWSNFPNDGVKYFSGTATYTKKINAPQSWFKAKAKVILDFGTVKEIAQVSVNGMPVGGILWKAPFQADVTEALKPGSNHLEAKVTNLWPNRIIGDLQPSATRKYTFLDCKPFRADSSLLESGLLGPVKLFSVVMR
jgi:hypothetical protein